MSAEEFDLPPEPVDPTVLMQFSRLDNEGNLLVKIHRRDGRYDRRVLAAGPASEMMLFLGAKLTLSLGEVNVLVPFPGTGRSDA